MLGIAPAEPSPRLEAYLNWISAGMHGQMTYMAREDRVARRRNLNNILPNAKSLIIVGLEYFTLKLPDSIANDPARGRFSNYAWAADYHDVMLPRLEKVADFVKSQFGTVCSARAYLDTGAILERSHAERAGLGFIGKNTMLINPRLGSFLFLGEILTDAPLDYDAEPPNMPGCGSCSRCLSACPTNAFPKPYVLDARRCISYLTIEHKGPIPRDIRSQMGNWVYGCDICQDVCPWQRFAKPQSEAVFAPLDLDRAAPPLTTLLTLYEEGFAEKYRGSAVFRIKRERLVRNACIAAGNSSLPNLAQYIEPLFADTSPLIRGHAAWAMGKLEIGRDELKALLRSEQEGWVQDEARHALR